MAGHMQSGMPEDPDSYHLDFSLDNPQFMDTQHMYRSQQFMPDATTWLEDPASINHHVGEQTINNTHYNFDQIDPSLWQFEDEQYHDTLGTTGPVYEPQEPPSIDPRLRNMQLQPTVDKHIPMQRTSSNTYRGHSLKNPEQSPPSNQPFSQVFVVPITDQGYGAESLDSNSMFCDFPGIAFRSFLPEGATTPLSTSRPSGTNRGAKKDLRSSSSRPIVMHGPTQPQVYGPFRNVSGQSENSSNHSTPYASSMSRLATPDLP